MTYDIVLVHKEEIIPGDTILCKDGLLRTVCKNNIHRDSFMGLTIFGDSYKLGYEKVQKAINLKG